MKSVFALYRAKLDEMFPTIEPCQMREKTTHLVVSDIQLDITIAHWKFMCDEAQRFVDADRVEKAMRWLGFLQGTFWSTGTYTLDDLKNHSRPDQPEP